MKDKICGELWIRICGEFYLSCLFSDNLQYMHLILCMGFHCKKKKKKLFQCNV